MSDKTTVLEIKGLTKSFGDNEVLKDINLTVYNGDKIVIIGPSGCGKSTLLRCINCMEDPTGGIIMFEGENLADMKVDINIHRQKIGMVFQQFNLFNNLTVLKNITLAPITIGSKKIQKAKTKNFFIKIGNIFRSKKNKKPLYDLPETKKELIEKNKQKGIELLKKIGLEDKADA